MNEISYTLLSDGSSDRALMPILTWLLRQHLIGFAIQPSWADLRRLPRPPHGLAERIRIAVQLFPCDLLFIHRDAEKEPPAKRVEEIRLARSQAIPECDPPSVCVVPVRMQEAWLLFDEAALRGAAGNPNGRQQLHLPRLVELDQKPDPKHDLHELLREASGLQGRRRRQFNVRVSAQRLPEFICDFAPLRRLQAFRALEEELQIVVQDFLR